MRQRKTKRGIERIAYSPSGNLLVGRDVQHELHVWDARTLDPIQTIPADDPRANLFDCLFRDGGVRFLQTQGYVATKQDLPATPPRPEHQQSLPGFAPHGYGWEWSAASHSMYTRHFACFGIDGQTFVGWHPAVPDSREGLWRFEGQQVRAFDWMSDWTVNAMGCSTDGRFLAAAFFSGSAGYEVALVDLQKEPPPWGVLYHTHDVRRLSWSPRVPLVAAAATRSVWLWDAPAVIERITKPRNPSDPPLQIQPLHRFTGFRKTIEGLAFSPDGTLLAAAAREGSVRIWEVASGREKVSLDGKSGTLNHLTYSPDGNTVATACGKGIVVWDVD